MEDHGHGRKDSKEAFLDTGDPGRRLRIEMRTDDKSSDVNAESIAGSLHTAHVSLPQPKLRPPALAFVVRSSTRLQRLDPTVYVHPLFPPVRRKLKPMMTSTTSKRQHTPHRNGGHHSRTGISSCRCAQSLVSVTADEKIQQLMSHALNLVSIPRPQIEDMLCYIAHSR
jgi:hypothetical protein